MEELFYGPVTICDGIERIVRKFYCWLGDCHTLGR